VQKHDASHLHYDFRLKIGNVLKSWAVPKGPPTKLNEKRLAIPTEDHPLAYATFSGTIQEGNYGAGTVKIWDHGTYYSLKQESLEESYDNGRMEIWLEGKKLTGPYALIKTHLGDNNWLLFKIKKTGLQKT
jgi:DNA ligase D-like protein (predicted 3'-phosphoesterase)